MLPTRASFLLSAETFLLAVSPLLVSTIHPQGWSVFGAESLSECGHQGSILSACCDPFSKVWLHDYNRLASVGVILFWLSVTLPGLIFCLRDVIDGKLAKPIFPETPQEL